jgi:DNA-binding GntR family transcriptional regulator
MPVCSPGTPRHSPARLDASEAAGPRGAVSLKTGMKVRNQADSAVTAQARWAPIYEGLKSAILSHRLAPGAKLPEDELCGIFNEGRAAVRGALHALAHDRLVKLERNRGAFVAQPTRKEAKEVFEARALIEPRVAWLAATVASRDDVARLKRHIAQEDLAMAGHAEGEAISLSARFHVAIAEIAGQSILTEFVTELVSRSSLIVALYWQNRETTCESHSHHSLVDAISDGDRDRAADLMATHIRHLQSGLNLDAQSSSSRSLADILGRSP